MCRKYFPLEALLDTQPPNVVPPKGVYVERIVSTMRSPKSTVGCRGSAITHSITNELVEMRCQNHKLDAYNNEMYLVKKKKVKVLV